MTTPSPNHVVSWRHATENHQSLVISFPPQIKLQEAVAFLKNVLEEATTLEAQEGEKTAQWKVDFINFTTSLKSTMDYVDCWNNRYIFFKNRRHLAIYYTKVLQGLVEGGLVAGSSQLTSKRYWSNLSS